MAEPSEKELISIKMFRKMVYDLELTESELTDMGLLVWLRARDMDLKKAYDMLKTCLEWRKLHDIANILEWDPPPSYSTEFQYRISGEDHNNSPVCFLPYGNWDVRSIIETGEKETWLKYTDKLFGTLVDQIAKQSKAKNKIITQFVVIIDCKGFTMRQLASFGSIDSVLEVVRRFEANYPESLKAAYAVNAPFIFNILFNLVKPLLSKRTLGKVEIYGSNDRKWKPVLLKNIDAIHLPILYGGTDPFNFTYTDKGKPSSDRSAEPEEFLCTYVKPGQQLALEYDITHPKTIIKWTFKTNDYDIGFSVNFNKKLTVFPYNRVDCHIQPEQGMLVCDNPGKYILTFDNSYSKMTRKTLHYYIDTTLPIDVLEDKPST